MPRKGKLLVVLHPVQPEVVWIHLWSFYYHLRKGTTREQMPCILLRILASALAALRKSPLMRSLLIVHKILSVRSKMQLEATWTDITIWNACQ